MPLSHCKIIQDTLFSQQQLTFNIANNYEGDDGIQSLLLYVFKFSNWEWFHIPSFYQCRNKVTSIGAAAAFLFVKLRTDSQNWENVKGNVFVMFISMTEKLLIKRKMNF